MGLVKDEDFESALTNSKSKEVIPSEPITGEVIDYSKGRGHNPEVPNSLRQIIGETGAVDGRGEAVDLANRFGISPSSVSAYTNGSTSTASYDKKVNLPFINKAKERVSRRAIKKLNLALESMTEDKLFDTKARELAGIAKDMSAIVKNMEPEKEVVDPSKTGPTFVFYSPAFKQENTFEIVHAKE